jgi:hypothetical protein
MLFISMKNLEFHHIKSFINCPFQDYIEDGHSNQEIPDPIPNSDSQAGYVSGSSFLTGSETLMPSQLFLFSNVRIYH